MPFPLQQAKSRDQSSSGKNISFNRQMMQEFTHQNDSRIVVVVEWKGCKKVRFYVCR